MRIQTDFDLTNYNSYRVQAKCKSRFFLKIEEVFGFLLKCEIIYCLRQRA